MLDRVKWFGCELFNLIPGHTFANWIQNTFLFASLSFFNFPEEVCVTEFCRFYLCGQFLLFICNKLLSPCLLSRSFTQIRIVILCIIWSLWPLSNLHSFVSLLLCANPVVRGFSLFRGFSFAVFAKFLSHFVQFHSFILWCLQTQIYYFASLHFQLNYAWLWSLLTLNSIAFKNYSIPWWMWCWRTMCRSVLY